MKRSKSERQADKPAVPVSEQKRRILASLASVPHDPMRNRGAAMSSLAYIAFPDFRFKSPQGAALCISRTVRELMDSGYLRHCLYGYEITSAGRSSVK